MKMFIMLFSGPGDDAHHASFRWDDQTEFYSGHCEFFVMREHKWQSQGHGIAKLMLHSSGAEFFQF